MHAHCICMVIIYVSINYSTKLCEQLVVEKRTHACGTLRRGRGAPKVINEATNMDLRGGEDRISRHNTKVATLAWKDTNVVRMVTTFHQDVMGEVQVWSRKLKKRVPKPKPVCVLDYNKHMNGVDRYCTALFFSFTLIYLFSYFTVTL